MHSILGFDRFGRFFVFWVEQVFETLIIWSHERFWPDYSGICKIAGAVPESADPVDLKILFVLFGNSFCIDDLRLHLIRPVQCSGLINIPEVSSDPHFKAVEILVPCPPKADQIDSESGAMESEKEFEKIAKL